jgi:multidrug efflux pump subunit AcrB
MLRRRIGAVSIIAGSVVLSLLAADSPKVDLPAVNILTALPGASPERVAASVATPLERQLSTIAGVRSMTSISRLGETSITIRFDPNRDLDTAASDVLAAIEKVQPQLPSGVTSPLVRKRNPADAPILYLALTSETVPLTELSEFAQSRMARRISFVPGVADVSLYGAVKRVTRIQLDADALSAYAIAVDQVEAALGAEEQSAMRAADLLSIAVAHRNGIPVRLGDIAKAFESVENDKTPSWYNDRQGVILAVQQVPTAKPAEIAADIRKLLPDFRTEKPAVNIEMVETLTDSILGSTDFAPGVSLRQMAEYQRQAAAILAKDPNVESVISVLGAQVYVGLKKEHQQNVDEIIAGLRRKLAMLPGLKVHLWNPKTGRRNYTITGTDFGELAQRTSKILEELQTVPGVEDLASDLHFADPHLSLNIDQDTARAAGVTTAQIENAFSIATGTHRILHLQGNPQSFSKLYVEGHSGKLVRLDTMTTLAMTTGPLAVNHTGLLPSVTFSFNLRPGVDLDKVLSEMENQ